MSGPLHDRPRVPAVLRQPVSFRPDGGSACLLRSWCISILILRLVFQVFKGEARAAWPLEWGWPYY